MLGVRVGRVGVAVAALVPIMLSGCTSGSSPTANSSVSAAPSVAVSPTTTVSASGEAEAQVLSAYRGMWADTVEASKTSNSKSPLLARHATGAALAQMVQRLYTAKQKGYVTRGDLVLNPQVRKINLDVTPQTAEIIDCADTSRWLLYKASGAKVADDSSGDKRQITADVAAMSGDWKVTDFEVAGSGSC